MYYYLRWMGFLVWAATLVAVVVLCIKTIKACRNHECTGMKVCLILAMIVNAVLGSAIGVLFYQVANLVK